jgi:hypothetical protein
MDMCGLMINVCNVDTGRILGGGDGWVGVEDAWEGPQEAQVGPSVDEAQPSLQKDLVQE